MTETRHRKRTTAVKCKKLEPVPTAVAHPCEKTALRMVEVGKRGAIRPILVGPAAKIEAVAKAAVDLDKSKS
jgi:Fe-S-cluster-containing hydrogenase component 2